MVNCYIIDCTNIAAASVNVSAIRDVHVLGKISICVPGDTSGADTDIIIPLLLHQRFLAWRGKGR